MILNRDNFRKGHLSARPGQPERTTAPLYGLQRLELDSKKENLIYIPSRYDPRTPARLAVMLHGAGGNAAHGMSLLKSFADDFTIILVAPASEDYSWDIIASNSFGHDVLLIDEALAFVLKNFSINPNQIAIGGFSDGASYALCIGLSNGDLFTHVIAFSPGFSYTVENRGTPEVFIAHGTKDPVLPITPCSRRIVPQLERRGIPVLYREFDGEHVIPAQIATDAVEWFTGDQLHKP